MSAPEEPHERTCNRNPPSQFHQSPALESSLTEARQEIASLRTEVDGLRQTMQSLQEQLTKLKEALGASD